MSPTRRQQIDAYLNELIEVGRRHGFSLSHEDGHGAFLVDEPSEDNERWLLGAWDARGDAEETGE